MDNALFVAFSKTGKFIVQGSERKCRESARLFSTHYEASTAVFRCEPVVEFDIEILPRKVEVKTKETQ